MTNPCDRKKCEWLCLLSPSGPVCTCPNGRTLDNGTCVELPTPTLSPICEYTHTLSHTNHTHTHKHTHIDAGCLNNSCHKSLAPPSGPCLVQCMNGGSCFLNAHKQPKCRCQPNYGGDRCEIDQCRDYCKNGGTCTPSPTGKIWTFQVYSSLNHSMKAKMLHACHLYVSPNSVT